MFGVFGGGALAGALVYSAIGHRLPRRRTFLCCFAGVPVGYLALATLPPLPVALAALAVAGLAAGPINPLLFTVLTEIVPTQLRGRVFGAVRAARGRRFRSASCSAASLVGAIGVAADVPRDRRAPRGRRRLRLLQPGVPGDGTR